MREGWSLTPEKRKYRNQESSIMRSFIMLTTHQILTGLKKSRSMRST
jgi:hypothetical protein